MPDLMTTNTFTLEVGGVTIATFRKVTGLTYKTEVIESKEVTKEGKMIIRKVPGATKWEPLVLERRVDEAKMLEEWRQEVLAGNIDKARRDGSIVQFNSMLEEVARWNFEKGWPSDWSASDLDAGTNSIATEKVTIQHERLYRA
ncbi:phage tail protein [Thalassiella azotivora]